MNTMNWIRLTQQQRDDDTFLQDLQHRYEPDIMFAVCIDGEWQMDTEHSTMDTPPTHYLVIDPPAADE